jgi:hypothetical protein
VMGLDFKEAIGKEIVEIISGSPSGESLGLSVIFPRSKARSSRSSDLVGYPKTSVYSARKVNYQNSMDYAASAFEICAFYL